MPRVHILSLPTVGTQKVSLLGDDQALASETASLVSNRRAVASGLRQDIAPIVKRVVDEIGSVPYWVRTVILEEAPETLWMPKPFIITVALEIELWDQIPEIEQRLKPRLTQYFHERDRLYQGINRDDFQLELLTSEKLPPETEK